jgi:phage tail-like protein
MAETRSVQKARYPLPAYNFRVSIDGASMSFSEVSGISLEYQTLTYKHGLSFWEGQRVKQYYSEKYVPITLKRGTVQGMGFLYEWIARGASSPRTLEVSLCDEAGQPVVTWRIAKAIPVKLQAPRFDAGTNDVSVESLELMGAGISVEHH